MMNIFYHDRISLGLASIEEALSKMNQGDAEQAASAVTEIRHLVEDTYEISKHAENIWNDCAFEIGQIGEMGGAHLNPSTGARYTYVDQWAARYELIRREIVRKLNNGYSIGLIPPSIPTFSK